MKLQSPIQMPASLGGTDLGRLRELLAKTTCALCLVITSIVACTRAAAGLLISPAATEATFPTGQSQTWLEFYVANDGPPLELLGVNLNLQIADGGPEAGGFRQGPPIGDVDLFPAGSLFASNNNGRGGSGSIVPQLFEAGTLARPGTTVTLGPGTHLLAVALLDTTGFSAGQSWVFSLDTLNGPSVLLDGDGRPFQLALEGGILTAIPEPAEYGIALAAAAAAAAAGFACRRRTRSRLRSVSLPLAQD
ncbi:MAG: hypothetical protein AB7O66_17220 [Limisphaerales bacterium]